MKTYHPLRGGAAALLVFASFLQAQPTPGSEETISLPEFTIHTQKDVSYIGKQALSTTRTGVELLDLPQSVKVLNRAFIDDINPTMQGDVLKYVGGAQTGNLNFSVDRFMLRGFTGESDYQDGFRASQSESQADMAPVERMEIIKGPSAIFIANGHVGGVVNKISKSPVSYDVRTVRLQVGLFDANRIELDLGGPLSADKSLQYRLVTAGQYSEGWYDRTYVHRFLVAPSFAYDFGPKTRVTVKYQHVDTRFSSYNGVPIDLRTNTMLAEPSEFNSAEDFPLNYRTDVVDKLLMEFTTRVTDFLAVRVAALGSTTQSNRVESIMTSAQALAALNGGTLAHRNTTVIDNSWPRRTVQVDLVFTFKTGPVSHKLLAGADGTDNPTHSISWAGTSSDIDPLNPSFPGTVTVNRANRTSDSETHNRLGKIYALETANFFKDQLQVSLGASRNIARVKTTNFLTNTATPYFDTYQNLAQWGIVYKPISTVSLFSGYNENFSPNVLNGVVLPSQHGKQLEIGAKSELLEGRLSASIAYFDIKQVNLTAPAFPQTTPPSFVLVSGETSKGIDGDITFSVNKNIDVLAAFADFHASVPLNPPDNATAQPVNGQVFKSLPAGNVAQQTMGLFGRYRFTDTVLKGLSVGAGLDYQSKKAITNSANSRFYGYVPARTLANLVFTYDHGPIRYALNIDNLFDKRYVYAARSNDVMIPGSGFNAKFSATYKF